LHIPGIWDIVGLLLTLNKRTIMRTDRKKDLDTYYNDHLKMRIISRLMEIKTWSEIMGIQSYVIEAGFREQKAQHAEQEEFKAWKKKGKEKK